MFEVGDAFVVLKELFSVSFFLHSEYDPLKEVQEVLIFLVSDTQLLGIDVALSSLGILQSKSQCNFHNFKSLYK